jgi:dihydroxyacid dehydratase/phosphogluconate dehydratase
VDDRELERRRATWRPPTAHPAPGLLALYARLAGPADRGALMELDET